VEVTTHQAKRFDRRFPGERLTLDRAIAKALFARDRELKPTRAVAGESFKVRVLGTRRAGRIADPSPNAPLLKRVVLNPYVQTLGAPRRVSHPVGGMQAREARSPLKPAILVYREAIWPPVVGNPVRTIEHRPVPRPEREGIEAWLRARGDA
jgi:hypothetical protein